MWQILWKQEMTLILNDVKTRQLAPAGTAQCSGKQNTMLNCKKNITYAHIKIFFLITHLSLVLTLVYSKYKSIVDKMNQELRSRDCGFVGCDPI
jgi:hypothetical protein